MAKTGVILSNLNEVVARVVCDLPAGDCEYSYHKSYDALLQYDILVCKRNGKLSYSKANLKRAEGCMKYADVFDAERREFLINEEFEE